MIHSERTVSAFLPQTTARVIDFTTRAIDYKLSAALERRKYLSHPGRLPKRSFNSALALLIDTANAPADIPNSRCIVA